ncbi:MAG: diguanylate cyclase [Vallitaleaceae bacterium]|nr:diguanylate cyclase [Vallitaleaceae bacterium]
MNLFSKYSLSLMNKIIIAFVAYFVMILITFSLIVVLIDRGQVLSISNEFSSTIATDKAKTVELWLNEKVTNVSTLALTSEVQSMNQEAFLPLLESALLNKEGIYGRYFIIDEQGILVDTLGIRKNLAEDPEYQKIMTGEVPVVVAKSSYDDTFKQPTFRIMVPIEVDGKVKGLLGTTVLLKDLSQLVSSTVIQETGYAWVVDEYGQVISHKDTNQVLNMDITSDENTDYEGLVTLSEQMKTSNEGMATFTNPQGEKNYVTYESIPGSPGWHVIITLYASSVYKTLRELFVYMTVLVVVLGLISYLVTYLLAKDITDSVKRLIGVMNKFTSGVKGIRAKVESQDEIGMLSQSFNAMADTIVAHTDNVEELIKERTQILADLNYQIVSRNKELGTMNEELEKTNDKLHELASTDMLTGLYNRHQFVRELQRTIELVNVEDEQNFSLLFIDLDNFKQYNDTFGHEIGDFLLIEVAKILRENVRENDIIGRYGGDEFVIMLRQGTYDIAKAIAERIHGAILGHDGFKKELSKKLSGEIKIMGKNKLSSSIGIVNYMKSMKITKAEDLLAIADETMYKAKKAGKSRVVVN